MRALVIEFDDNAGAERMIKQLKGRSTVRVVGLFAMPEKFCFCPTPEGYHKDEVVRGAKYGWWVHRVCRLPILGSHQVENLLPIQDVPLDDRVYMSRISSLGIFQLLTKKAKRHGKN
jgi:hypothetical protein